MSKKRNKWSLNQEEVQMYGGSSNIGGRKNPSQSRALDTTSLEWNLIHVPTGEKVYGEVPSGNYSKKEMKKLHEQLLEKLFKELEAKVAKKLRAPGYA
jgi:hypothetical protein